MNCHSPSVTRRRPHRSPGFHPRRAHAYQRTPEPGSATTFAHRERKYGPVRAGGDNHGTMSGVTPARNSSTSVQLVARRHVDFKRVCSCCCLP
ncbi:Ms4527A family Cys-rich leader peptide [Mycolicibacterium frederiksbergense]|uniref:Ms4527A family Cys-rich leader peptide n=1 Tax=Mycolicibacterium frederiksbergense TaxID=117567 RepID=UPI00355739EE